MSVNREPQSSQNVPRATYRFQFNEHFRLRDAIALIPYLSTLGISHVYASPLFLARPHSTHGYDVCDFTKLNPELGTEADLQELADKLHRLDMGLVVDIVPNHMGIGTKENRWWWDVLTHGQGSNFANYFDIDWNCSRPELRGKVLVPVLGDAYQQVLARGELQLAKEDFGFVLRYFDHRFPVSPESLPPQLRRGDATNDSAIREINSNAKTLDKLVRQQHYLLADWHKTDTDLNYRRFFCVADLMGVRMEDENVFNETHALLKRWLEAGWIDGVRVDHPDGLRDPEQYLQRLRSVAPNAWIIVEKITEPGESLPTSWPISGTTGYDFLDEVGGLFIEREGEKPLTDFYASFTGEPVDCKSIAIEKKRLILRNGLTTEVNRLAGMLTQITAQDSKQSFSSENYRDVIIELAAAFPVYRTYIRADVGAFSKEDAAHIEQAVFDALEQNQKLDQRILKILTDLFFERRKGPLESDFVMRFQQLTGAAMAKGVEDTTFYCFNRLLALNEVGGDPGRFGLDVKLFHEICESRARDWPEAMLGTSTHDTKRSEDTRARMSLLSEIPAQWRETVLRWSKMNERHRTNNFPDRNAEYHFYQILVGAWPLSVERAVAYMKKAAWEAKQHTNWTQHNEAYENALQNFVSGTLQDKSFIDDLESFLKPLMDAGHINSLAQTLIKLTAPGVPDFYQGSELWDFSLVDPDNRRPVDFIARQRLLAETGALMCSDAWRRRAEGLPKMWMIRRALIFRAARPDLFARGSKYQPLVVRGSKARHVVAFMRGDDAITVAPRFILELGNNWDDTSLELPAGTWRNLFTEEIFESNSLALADLLRDFPMALLVRKENA